MIVETCQRWAQGRERRRPAGELIKTSAYDVAPIATDDEARAFVREHHYAKEASSTAHRFGLYRSGELVGVALFGPGASVNAHNAVWGHTTLTMKEAVTLGRLVLLDNVPGNGESWFVSRCFELLATPKLYRPFRKDGTPRRPVVAVESCADPQPRLSPTGETVFRGHLGIVYQATNGRYVGKTNDSTLRIFPDGSVFNNRTSGKLVRGERGDDSAIAQLERWGAAPLQPDEDPIVWLKRWRSALTRSMRHRGNHRYLWCLDRRRRREVLNVPKLSYPKENA